MIGFKNALSSKFIVIKERTTPVMFIKLKDHLSLKNKQLLKFLLKAKHIGIFEGLVMFIQSNLSYATTQNAKP